MSRDKQILTFSDDINNMITSAEAPSVSPIHYIDTQESGEPASKIKKLKRNLKLESLIDNAKNQKIIDVVNNIPTYDDSKEKDHINTISLKVFSKSIKLDSNIRFDDFSNNDINSIDMEDIIENKIIPDINDFFRSEIIKNIETLSKKSRIEESLENIFFDIDLTDKKDLKNRKAKYDDSMSDDEFISKKLLHRMIASSSRVAMRGRIGPANFIMMNSELAQIMDHFINDNKLQSMNIIINNSLKDKFIVGRNNKPDHPSLQLFYSSKKRAESFEGGSRVLVDINYKLFEVSESTHRQYCETKYKY